MTLDTFVLRICLSHSGTQFTKDTTRRSILSASNSLPREIPCGSSRCSFHFQNQHELRRFQNGRRQEGEIACDEELEPQHGH